ncbi:hypothetical protein MASR2M78_25900 [Treponema sp.]
MSLEDGMDTALQIIDTLNKEAWDCMLRSPSHAALLSEDAVERATASDYPQGKALALLNLSWCHFYLSELDKAAENASASLELFSDLNDLVGVSKAFMSLGSVEHERGNYNTALDRFMKALELARAVNRKDREAAALNNVGEVLKDSGETKEALSYFMQAADAMQLIDKDNPETEGSVELESSLFANIGQAFIDLGETSNALSYLELALGAAEINGDTTSHVRALKGLAVAARRSGNRDEAVSLLEQASTIAAATKQNLILAEILFEQAVLHIEGDETDAALAILNKALALVSRAGAKKKVAESYRYLALAHEGSFNYQAALSAYKNFHETEESISADRIEHGIRDAEIRFELDHARQEAGIFRLKNVELKEHREELEKTNDRLKAVAEIGWFVTSSLDIEAVAKTVHESLSKLMDMDDFCLAVHHPEKKEINFALFINKGEAIKPLTLDSDNPNSFAAWVIANNKPLHINDAELEYQDYIQSDLLIQGSYNHSIIYAPLSIGGLVVGAVGIQCERIGAYGTDDLNLINSIAPFIAVALQNSRSHAELQRLNTALSTEKTALERLARKVSRIANHDGLTGLPNRLLLGELLEKAISLSSRTKKTLALLYMDLDDFKPINDLHGHAVGDQALIAVAARLKQALRASDVVARVGGDEFIALVADVEDEKAAELVAKKLVDAFNEPINLDGKQCKLGLSIGIALYPGDAQKSDELIRRADEAMYIVKRSGKRNYMFYSECCRD